jgi:hypothetical protein
MKCSKCGKDLDNDAVYCKYCGTRVSAATEGGNSNPQRRKMRLTTVVLSISVVALLIVVAYLLIRNHNNLTSPQRQVLVDNVVSVPAHGSTPYKFTLTRDALVTGNFRAFGGTGNDVAVLVMDADSYVNWMNGHQVKAYYNSGQETVGSLSVMLSPRTYYLVFDNHFSAVTDKSVEAHVDLVAR